MDKLRKTIRGCVCRPLDPCLFHQGKLEPGNLPGSNIDQNAATDVQTARYVVRGPVFHGRKWIETGLPEYLDYLPMIPRSVWMQWTERGRFDMWTGDLMRETTTPGDGKVSQMDHELILREARRMIDGEDV